MSDRVRVLVVSHAAVLPVNQEPFDALARAGAEVTVVAPRALRSDLRGTLRYEALPDCAATVRPVPVLIGGYRRILGGQRGIHVLVYAGLKKVFDEVRPQVVFAEEEPFSFAALQVARMVKKRSIPFVVHENQNIERPLPPPFSAIRKVVLASAAGVTVRNAAAADLVKRHGFTGAIEDFPHAVDPRRFAGGERRTDLPSPTVGFVGRLVEEKGIFDLIDAIKRLPDPASLLVIGDGPSMEEAKARAEGLRARFTGPLPHDDVPGWYASMDVVAIPSHTTPTWMEQFGRIVIEANAAGVPTVVSDSGELPRTVASTGGGIAVAEKDVAALAKGLGGLLADPDRRRAMGEAGRAAVLDRFTPTAVSGRLARFLEGLAR